MAKDFSNVFGSKKTPGKWFTFEDTGSEFLIVNLNNPSVNEYCYKNGIDLGTDSKDTAKILDLFINKIVLDWKGVVIEGEEIAFSPERAKEIFINYPAIFIWVTDKSREFALALLEQKETLKKN